MLYAREKSSNFAQKKMKTFEIIRLLIKADLWKYCQVLFKRAETLNRYYRIYECILFHEPLRSRGYIRRSLEYEDIKVLLPKPNRKEEGWDVQSIKWVIQEMEREIWV